MDESRIDLNLERKIINHYIKMTDLFDKLGIEYSEHSNMFCPFHENVSTPAAHYHTDSNLLWCYSEQRMYGSWNVLKIFYPNVNTNKLAIGIAKKFGLERIERELGELELNNDIPFMKELEQFKTNKISYKTLCEKISEYYI